jgi:LmbE family N-acetylglucosaminyl deacetylase
MRKLLVATLRSGLVILLAAHLALAQAPAAQPPSPAPSTTAGAYRPRVLIVVAHPDDESCFAATVYEITHNLGGTVDQLVITNGEGGYRYSLLAESFYGVALTDEAVGRAALPEIRKRELLEAGRILGVANHFFLDQPDLRYTQDIDEVLNQHWQPGVVLPEVARRIAAGHYDFIFTLFPSPETHGAHKAATITALSAVEQMQDAGHRPVVLGCQTASGAAPEPSWKGFENPLHPFQVVLDVFTTDRNVKFGFNNALDYQIVVNWEIAAHKSQGLFQEAMNRADREEFVVLEGAKGVPKDAVAEQAERVRGLFHALAEQAPHPRGYVCGAP